VEAVSLGLTLAVSAGLIGCSGGKAAAPAAPPPVPVLAAAAERKDVPLQVHAIGAVESYSTVSVKTQVTGELTGVFFREGQDVKKGDLLFSLDKRPFEAELKKQEGNLARDLAQARNARAQAKRYEALWQTGVVSKEQFDQVQTSADALDAAVQADRAAVEDAKVQLQYCTLYSPINGRTGSLIVHQGNMIKANDNPPLVIINQVQPIYTTFTVPEQFLPEIKKFMAHGKLRVAASAPSETGAPVLGTLTFVDNMVDQTTGSIKLKAEFSNGDRRLWPGQFVNVVLTLRTQLNVVVVPSQAVQTGQQGTYVFVIRPDMTVESRLIVVGASSDGQTVVQKGLEAGERVVTDGQLRLVPNSRVEIKTAGMFQPPLDHRAGQSPLPNRLNPSQDAHPERVGGE
jgi:multidrug efflux system membrane fusion protein